MQTRPRRRGPAARRWLARRALLYAGLAAFAAVTLIPFAWMISSSLKTPAQAASMTGLVPAGLDRQALRETADYWIPPRPRWDNYLVVLGLDPERTRQKVNFAHACVNSFFIALAVTFGQVLTSSMSGYAFARLRWPGRDKVFLMYLGTLMIPGVVTMVPGFLIIRGLGWIDTYQGLIVPGLFTAFGTFLCRQYMLGLSREIEESAMMDGASYFGIYWHIVLPLSKPVLVALCILTFLGQWPSFMGPLVLTYSERYQVAGLALYMLQGRYSADMNLVMAGTVLMTLPSIVIFVVGQRFFVEGIQLGGVKG